MLDATPICAGGNVRPAIRAAGLGSGDFHFLLHTFVLLHCFLHTHAKLVTFLHAHDKKQMTQNLIFQIGSFIEILSPKLPVWEQSYRNKKHHCI